MIVLLIAFVENPDYRNFLTDLYNEYKDNMFYYAYSILQDPYLAEDAVNQAFIGIIKNVEKIFCEDVSKQKPYIVISVRNACYDMVKKRGRRQKNELLTDSIDEGIGNEWEPLADDNSDYLATAVLDLSERYQRVILLRYYLGYSYKEIATAMNISVKQVSVMLSRAKAILRKKITKDREKDEKNQQKF